MNGINDTGMTEQHYSQFIALLNEKIEYQTIENIRLTNEIKKLTKKINALNKQLASAGVQPDDQ